MTVCHKVDKRNNLLAKLKDLAADPNISVNHFQRGIYTE